MATSGTRRISFDESIELDALPADASVAQPVAGPVDRARNPSASIVSVNRIAAVVFSRRHSKSARANPSASCAAWPRLAARRENSSRSGQQQRLERIAATAEEQELEQQQRARIADVRRSVGSSQLVDRRAAGRRDAQDGAVRTGCGWGGAVGARQAASVRALDPRSRRAVAAGPDPPDLAVLGHRAGDREAVRRPFAERAPAPPTRSVSLIVGARSRWPANANATSRAARVIACQVVRLD